LVRASNTGPVLVLRFEGDSAQRLAEIQSVVEGRLAAIMAEVGAPPRWPKRTERSRHGLQSGLA
jgi:hypothetical protein